MDKLKDWQDCNSETFWCEVGSCSHVVQLYESEQALLNLLEDFMEGGVLAEDCVLIIATNDHLQALEKRMRATGLDMDALRASGQYIPFDANETLARFMQDDRMNQERFLEVIQEMFDRVHATGRKVRAFGEMVAILWEQGNRTATMLVEQYWNELLEKEAFPLFCAYPKNKFPEDAASALSAICKTHSKIITHSNETRFDLSYREVV